MSSTTYLSFSSTWVILKGPRYLGNNFWFWPVAALHDIRIRTKSPTEYSVHGLRFSSNLRFISGWHFSAHFYNRACTRQCLRSQAVVTNMRYLRDVSYSPGGLRTVDDVDTSGLTRPLIRGWLKCSGVTSVDLLATLSNRWDKDWKDVKPKKKRRYKRK